MPSRMFYNRLVKSEARKVTLRMLHPLPPWISVPTSLGRGSRRIFLLLNHIRPRNLIMVVCFEMSVEHTQQVEKI